jgi:hypothetical protein
VSSFHLVKVDVARFRIKVCFDYLVALAELALVRGRKRHLYRLEHLLARDPAFIGELLDHEVHCF